MNCDLCLAQVDEHDEYGWIHTSSLSPWCSALTMPKQIWRPARATPPLEWVLNDLSKMSGDPSNTPA